MFRDKLSKIKKSYFNPQKRIASIALILLVIVPTVILLSTIFSSKVEASWYSDDWYYRMQINIASHTSTENNVYITVPSFNATDTTKFQADCGDLRFTKTNGEELQYYVVSCSATSEVRVLFDTLTSGASSLFMYYGNATVSDGFSTTNFSTAATGLGAITFASEEKGSAPIAWWKFDQTTGTLLNDSTSNQINGTLINMDPATDWLNGTNCKLNGCLDFDGTNDYIDIADNSKLKPTGHFSISAWFKTSLGSQQQFFSSYSQNTLPAGIILGVNAANSSVNKISIMSGRNSPGTIGIGYQAASSTSDVNDGQWHHVVGVWNGTNLMLYLDGKLESSVAWSFAPVYGATNYIHIGNHQSSPATQIGYLDGALDNLKVYNYALTQDQVRNDMSTSIPMGSSGTLLPTPLIHYNFDEESGQVVNNSISSSFSGTFGADTSSATDDPVWESEDSCHSNACINFDGTNDYINVGNIGSLGTAYSVSAWVKYNTGGSGTILAYRTDNQPNGNNVAIQLDGFGSNHRFIVRNGAGTIATATSTGTVDTQWNHIVGVRDGNNIKIYVNGVLRHSTSASLGSITMNRLTIGTLYNDLNNTIEPSGNMNGNIDEVKIFTQALTEEQVMLDYGTSASAFLLTHYKFDEQSGQIVNNSASLLSVAVLGSSTSSSTDDPTWQNPDNCRTNSCLLFDGTSDYISVASPPEISLNHSRCAWFNSTSSTSIGQILASGTTTAGVYLAMGNGRILVGGSTSNFWTSQTSNSIVNTGEWVHTCAVFTGGNSVGIYINGVLDKQNTQNYTVAADHALTISKNQVSSTQYFPGKLDELKIYNHALSAEQVRLDYNAGAALNVGTTATTLGASLTGGNGNAPIAEYLFTENTGTSTGDSSTNNSTGTLNNGATWAPGKVGSSVFLDGVDDNVTFPSSTPLNIGTSDFTIEAFVKGNNLENSDIIVGKTDGGGCSATYGYSLGIFDSLYPTLYFCTAAGSHAKIQGTQALNNNQWYHIVVVVDRDSTANTRMYIDGIAVTTTVANLATHTGSITNTVDLAVGSESDNGFNWSGEIDQVRIYNYVRNQTQIMYNFNKGAPVGWWKFDQSSGTVAYDSSTYASNGTLVNMDPATDWVTDGSCPFNNNNCLDFDNVNDTVTVPYSTKYDPGNSFSVGAWVYPRTYATCTNPDYADFVISKGNDNVAGAFYISICTGGTSTFVIRSNSGGHSAAAGAGTVPLNQWTHLFGTYDGTSVRFYVNGVLRSTSATGAVTVPAYNALLRIGSNSTPTFPYYFNGMIDDVRVYKYPLSATQVQQVYNNGAALLYE